MFKILSTARSGGYIYCRTDPPHPKSNSHGLYLMHRVVVENSLGRLLLKKEVIHHKDEDRTNNELSNLEIMTQSEHARHHALERAPASILCVCDCGSDFWVKPCVFRRRMLASKTGRLFCSRQCAYIFTNRPIGEKNTLHNLDGCDNALK